MAKYYKMFRRELYLKIGELLNSLKYFKELEANEIADENLRKSFEEIKEEIIRGIEKISRDIEYLSKEVEWDSFNIAFFGETNAGKSTLIEALIRGDGRSIGDGRKDYTKRINKKSIENINFLDMPGLEGNENKVIHEIRKAVNKAHVVFYVIGTNKEPEEGTLRKVNSLLNKRSKVYSVINIRGKPIVYKYKKQLIDENVKKLEERVRYKLQNILKDHYYGNISLNAFIAFLATGKPDREDLRKEQEKAKSIFGSLDDAYHFSNLYEIEKIIEDFRKNSIEEVKVANTYKFLSSLEVMLSRILRNKKEFDRGIAEINNLVEKYQQEVREIYSKYRNLIIDSIDSILDKMRNEMRGKVYEGINKKWSENTIRHHLRKIEGIYSKRIRDEMKNILGDMEWEINSRIKEFEEKLNLYIALNKIKVEINLREIIEKLKIDFSYIFKQLLDVGLSVLGVWMAIAVSPIVVIITASLALLRKIWDWFLHDPEKRKREAKRKAYEEIEESVKNAKMKIHEELNRKFKSLDGKIQKPVKLLKWRIKKLREISVHIDEMIKVIKRTQRDISTLLVQEVVDKNVKFAYIDLSLSSILIIGTNGSLKNNILQIRNILTFSSINECVNNLEHKIENQTIYIKGEFFYRALNALILDDETFNYKIKKWRER